MMSSLAKVMVLRLLQETGEDHDHDHDHDEDGEHEHEHHDDMHDDDHDKPWGEVVAAGLIVSLATFCGILVFGVLRSAGMISKSRSVTEPNASEATGRMEHVIKSIIIPAFASGALLATTVFLLIPEALILIGGGHEEEGHTDRMRLLEEEEGEEHHHEDNESEIAWKFGAALIGGFLLPLLVSALFPSHSHGEHSPVQNHAPKDDTVDTCENEDSDKADTDTSKNVARQDTPPEDKPQVNYSLLGSIVIGDGLHNFVDGVFLGNSFLLCSRSIAYSLVATTIYHEIAQEIVDFFLLTDACNLTTIQALAINFFSGLSVIIGGLVILAVDLSDVATGVILAVSAGVYVYIAAAQCIPRIHMSRSNPSDTLAFLISFVLGVVPIGLVLLNHEHCDGEDEHDH